MRENATASSISFLNRESRIKRPKEFIYGQNHGFKRVKAWVKNTDFKQGLIQLKNTDLDGGSGKIVSSVSVNFVCCYRLYHIY